MSEKLTFYKCLESDLETITALAHQIWPITFADILSEEQIKYMLEWMYSPTRLALQLEEGHLFYIVYSGELAIGFVGIEMNFPVEGSLRIHKFYLSPKYHGKRIGSWMMERIQEIAQSMKMRQLHLNVNKYNAAVQVYKTLGFKQINEEDIDIGNGYFMNDYVMVKYL